MIRRGGEVKYNWDANTVAFTLTAMGQTMRCTAIVVDAQVHRVVDLPTMLALFGGRIEVT
jgi:hypothetical protein